MPKPNYRSIPVAPVHLAMTKGNAMVIAGVPPRWVKFGPCNVNEEEHHCRAVILRANVAAPVSPHPAGSRTHIRPPITRPLVKMFLDWLSKFVGTRCYKFSEILLAPNSCNLRSALSPRTTQLALDYRPMENTLVVEHRLVTINDARKRVSTTLHGGFCLPDCFMDQMTIFRELDCKFHWFVVSS